MFTLQSDLESPEWLQFFENGSNRTLTSTVDFSPLKSKTTLCRTLRVTRI